MDTIKKPRGTMDIMQPEISAWRYVEETARKCASMYGFSEIRTPTFEDLRLFKRGVGEGTDVVQKEMYTFEDREGRAFALRPEGTASVVRAIIENGATGGTMPLKYFYLINCFRYEKPQAGRSREFFQFGCEMFGAASPAADFTVIALADSILKALKLKNISLHINSIGCPNCRPKYREALLAYLNEHRSQLCETCLERIEKNPLRVLDCKNDSCRHVAENAPRTVDHLCDECEDHMNSLKRFLDSAGIQYTLDPHIVRGLDYYTKTVFEFIADGIGAQSTVCGGGRYDGLVSELGGPKLSGLGFGMGITRLLLAMKESGVMPPDERTPDVYFAPMGENAQAVSLALTERLRAEGVLAECDVVGRSLKAQMKYADKLGARFTAIIGDNEIEKGECVMKNMSTSEQITVNIDADSIAKLVK